MRKESIILLYRQALKEEEKTLKGSLPSPLGTPMEMLNHYVEGKTHVDIFGEITKAIEPALKRYLKQITFFQEREQRKEALYKYFKISDKALLRNVPMKEIDKYVEDTLRKSGAYAGFTGSVGAIAGVAVSMMELPVLLKTATDALEHICDAYGYDSNDYFEKLYIAMIIPYALCNGEEDRHSVYNKMKLIETWITQKDISLSERESFYPPQEAATFCAVHLARALVSNRLLQALPLAGAILGATMNYDFVNRLGRCGQMFYRRRHLEQRLGL